MSVVLFWTHIVIEIRHADIDDIPQIAQLTAALSKEFIAPDCTTEGAERLLSSMSEMETRQRFAEGYRHLVACAEGQIVGVVATRDDSHLYHLFVAASHQRQGLGRKLWLAAQEICLAHGNRGQFTVNSSRSSRKVYESFGFVAQDEVCVNGVPFIPMTLKLANRESS